MSNRAHRTRATLPVRFVLGVLLCLAFGLGGCTTTTTRSVEQVEPGEAVVVERETRVSHEPDVGCHGVLSCSVDVVGEVIALPFRLVGAAFRFVF